MFSNKANYLKLRTNLRLCINRFKLLEKKKTELALKARREIADYISAGKEDRARIRVEHIIREDYLIEAMEIVEMLCDLLLARFGLIEKMAELDPGLEEAISTLLWVTPRLSADVQELKEVALQLTIKYGKEYGEMCRRNGFQTVNEKVLHKLTLAAPPKILVENYMLEIAKSYKVPFEPDPVVMLGLPPETNDLIELGIDSLQPGANAGHYEPMSSSKQQEADSSDMKKPKPPSYTPGGGRGGGGGSGARWNTTPAGGQQGTNTAGDPNYVYTSAYGEGPRGPTCGGASGGASNIYHSGNVYSSSAVDDAYENLNEGMPNGRGGVMGVGGYGTSGGGYGGAGGGMAIYHSHCPTDGGGPQQPNNGGGCFQPGLPSGANPTTYSGGSSGQAGGSPTRFPPALPSRAPNAGLSGQQPLLPSASNANPPDLPLYDDVMRSPNQYPPTLSRPVTFGAAAAASPAHSGGSAALLDFPVLPDVPGLPSVPTDSVAASTGGGADDVDFDDLTRRFEELKKRK